MPNLVTSYPLIYNGVLPPSVPPVAGDQVSHTVYMTLKVCSEYVGWFRRRKPARHGRYRASTDLDPSPPLASALSDGSLVVGIGLAAEGVPSLVEGLRYTHPHHS